VMDRSLYYNNSGFDLLEERSVSKKMATALEIDLESSVSTAFFNHHTFCRTPSPFPHQHNLQWYKVSN
jgi:hypothetical protein